VRDAVIEEVVVDDECQNQDDEEGKDQRHGAAPPNLA
jgi:hypothetical protein